MLLGVCNQENSSDNNHHHHHQSENIELSYIPSDTKKPSEFKKLPDNTDVIGSIIGDIGKWQVRAIFLIYLCKIPAAFFMACIIFTAPTPRHGEFYCKPPKGFEIVNKTKWIKISHPALEDIHDKEFNLDYCNVYEDANRHAQEYFHNENYTNPAEIPRRNSNIIPCESFEYHPEYHSVITTFDLVCTKNILVSLTQFFHLFGVLWGGIIATRLLESISPKNVMLAGMYAQIFCGCFCGLINNFELHMMFRTASAVSCSMMYTAGSVIFTDITDGKYRVSVICLFKQFWSIGVILLPGIASFWSSWSALYCAISLPTFILVFLHRFIPDSPRWLIKKGRIRETIEILIEAAKMNKRTAMLPYDLEEQIKIQSKSSMDEPTSPPYWSIWKDKNNRVKLVACHISWSIFIIVLYAFLLNVRAYGRDYLEVNTAVAGVCELIGTFIGLFLILNTSKKWFIVGLMNVIGGAFSYGAFYIPQSIQGPQRIALLMCTSMVPKITVSAVMGLLFTCTTELVPQNKKKAVLYSTAVCARFWLLGAPFIAVTSIFGEYVPQSIMGTITIIGGFVTMLITSPKTLSKESNDTNDSDKLTNIKERINFIL